MHHLGRMYDVVITASCVGLAQVNYAIRINMKDCMQPVHLPREKKHSELKTPATSYVKQFNNQMMI